MVKKQNKYHQKVWFRRTRGSYLPVSAEGWLTYVPFLVYLIFALAAGINETDSMAVAILFIVPNWVAVTVVMTYIAAHKS